MCRFLLFLFVIFSLTTFSQQVSRQKVIVEVGTGTWCWACPYIVENIEEYWQGLSELDYVERAMFSSGNGTTFNFSGSAALSIPFTFTMDSAWNQENCKLVFFLQDNTTQEILQGEQIDLQDLPLQSGKTNNSETIELQAFSNPFSKQLNISGDDYDKIVITDVTERIVFSSDVIFQNINTSGWVTVMYFVTTVNGETRNFSKVLKK